MVGERKELCSRLTRPILIPANWSVPPTHCRRGNMLAKSNHSINRLWAGTPQTRIFPPGIVREAAALVGGLWLEPARREVEKKPGIPQGKSFGMTSQT